VDYLAPEILDCPVKHHPADHKANPAKWYTNKVDVWSVGILAYELLVGATPFEAVSVGVYAGKRGAGGSSWWQTPE
jgi:serine/threonine protein kinase